MYLTLLLVTCLCELILDELCGEAIPARPLRRRREQANKLYDPCKMILYDIERGRIESNLRTFTSPWKRDAMTLTLRCSSSSAASAPRFFFAAPAPRLRGAGIAQISFVQTSREEPYHLSLSLPGSFFDISLTFSESHGRAPHPRKQVKTVFSPSASTNRSHAIGHRVRAKSSACVWDRIHSIVRRELT